MRNLILVPILAICVFFPANALSLTRVDYKEEHAKWMKVLRTGDFHEKEVALSKLWFVYRKELCEDEKAFDQILVLLKDKDPKVREIVVAYFSRLVTFSNRRFQGTNVAKEKIVPSLIDSLSDSDPNVRREVCKALGLYKDKRAVEPLINRLQDNEPWICFEAAYALGELKDKKAVLPILTLLNNDLVWPHKLVQQESVIALRKIGDKSPVTIKTLMENFHDEYLKAEIIKTFNEFKTAEAIELLLSATKDDERIVRRLAVQAISNTPVKWSMVSEGAKSQCLELFIDLLKDPSPEVRAAAAVALGKKGDKKAIEPLIQALEDKNYNVQNNTVGALGKFKDKRILVALIPYLDTRRRWNVQVRKTFLDMAEKTSPTKKVYIYRLRDGSRKVDSNLDSKPKGLPSFEGVIHPFAVEYLFDQILKNPYQSGGLFDTLTHFEDERIEPYLIKMVEKGDPSARSSAIVALGHRYASKENLRYIIEALDDPDANVRKTAIGTLKMIRYDQSVEPILGKLYDPEDNVRVTAAGALGDFRDPQVIAPLITLLNDPERRVRNIALSSLAEFDDKKVRDIFLKMVTSDSSKAHGKIGGERVFVALTQLLDNETKRDLALRALTSFDRDKVESEIKTRFKEDERLQKKLLHRFNFYYRRYRREKISKRDIKPTSPEKASVAYSAGYGERVLPHQGNKGVSIGGPTTRNIVQKKGGRTFVLPGGSAEFGSSMREKPHSAKPISTKKEIPQEKKEILLSSEGFIQRPRQDITLLLKELGREDPRIRREAADKLGDVGDTNAAPSLISLLSDNDAYVRQAAARALGKLKAKDAVPQLITLLGDFDFHVRKWAIKALERIQDPRAVDSLSRLLLDNDKEIQNHSKKVLESFTSKEARRTMGDIFVAGLSSSNFKEQQTSLKLLAILGDDFAIKHLDDTEGDERKRIRNYIDLLLLSNRSSIHELGTKALRQAENRSLVIEILTSYFGEHARKQSDFAGKGYIITTFFAGLEDLGAIPFFMKLLNNSHDYPHEYRRNACFFFKKVEYREVVPLLRRRLSDQNEHYVVKMEAINVLAKYGDKGSAGHLLPIILDEKEPLGLRKAAVIALRDIGDSRAVTPLTKILENTQNDRWLRYSAIGALGNIADERAVSVLQRVYREDKDRQIKDVVQATLKKIGKQLEP